MNSEVEMRIIRDIDIEAVKEIKTFEDFECWTDDVAEGTVDINKQGNFKGGNTDGYRNVPMYFTADLDLVSEENFTPSRARALYFALRTHAFVKGFIPHIKITTKEFNEMFNMSCRGLSAVKKSINCIEEFGISMEVKRGFGVLLIPCVRQETVEAPAIIEETVVEAVVEIIEEVAKPIAVVEPITAEILANRKKVDRSKLAF